jgi:hypothetical protein
VNNGLAVALMGGVEAVPPPHTVVQPGVVGDTVTALVTAPALVTTPVTVKVALVPAGRLTVPAIEVPIPRVVVHVPVPVAVQVTTTDPTVGGTTSAMVAVPGPVPSLVTVIV